MTAYSNRSLQDPARENFPPVRVMLVDDHAMVRAGIARLLALEPDLQVVGEFADGDRAYAALQAEPAPADVLVLDLSMPGRSGLELMRRLRQRESGVRVLVCTMHDSPAMLAQALAAGAAGFVTKQSDPLLLADAIRRVARGESVLSPDVVAAAEGSDAPHLKLSPREFDVFLRLVRGEALETIADALKVAPKTVSNLQAAVRAKLGVGSAVELLRYARSHGLQPD